MDKSRLYSLLLVSAIGVRVIFVGDLEFSVAAIALGLLGLGMIWFAHPLATYWLGFGFWESKAKDFKQAGKQGPVIAFLGWLGLITLTVFVFLISPAD